ncbi:hypothetical protein [Nocardiopsis rhodophaea]|uniref:hypothetical protein n=1 Tax=Nocardiopsis rhodophaea TaxID=280238 RepID=UPI0031D953A6
MSTVRTCMVDTRADLDRWARHHRAPVTVVEDTWDQITYEAATGDGEDLHQCRYVYRFPERQALRRWLRTWVVGLAHDVGGADCCHVHTVTIDGVVPSPDRIAVLTAALRTKQERRAVCGATTETLTPYAVVRLAEWKG